jgi:hypothetical protein
VLEAGDQGSPIVVADADSAAARALSALAERVAEAMQGAAV